jgi:ligand-binding SRPBCC domain-containing protein
MVVPTRRPLRGPFEFRSVLASPADEVWAVATTFAGVNAELGPWLRMTHPPEWDRLDPGRIPLGERLFRSRLMLLGVPVDHDDLTLVEVGPGYRFLERSSMVSAPVWQHERVVEAVGPGACLLTDRVSFAPRWRWLGPVLARVVPWVFGHRHRQVRRRFGSGRDRADGG